jgi:hypothetical protein
MAESLPEKVLWQPGFIKTSLACAGRWCENPKCQVVHFDRMAIGRLKRDQLPMKKAKVPLQLAC